jgi:hypothetical protein
MAKRADRTLLAVIQAEVGYRERGDGWTKFAQWYENNKPAPGFARGAWCQMLISWAADEAGIPETVIPRMAYTPYAARWFKDRGQWGRVPRPGALVYYDWGGTWSIDAIDHVGVVKAVLPDGRIRTLEGNVSNQLVELNRSLAGVAGFAYPAYGTIAAAAAASSWTEKLVKDFPLIKPGAKGWDVKTIAHLLAARDFALPEGMDDTVYSPPFVARVKEFQRSEKIEADGEVGPKTLAKLLRVA